jgi:hypothetical protein
MNISSNQQILICIIIGIIIIFLFYKQSEGFATNTEAIQNITSLYNKDNLTATNIIATGSMWTTDITANGTIKAAGLNSPVIVGDLVSPGGLKRLKITDDGIIAVAEFNGTSLIPKITDLTATGTIRAAGVNAPIIIGNLTSPDGTKRLKIGNNGIITLTDGNGNQIRTL